MTELISLSCNHCGAPIDAPKTMRFVTCGHCNSRLEIKSTGNSNYTEVLDALQEMNERNADMADDLEAIRIHKDIEKLDRDWMQQSRALSTEDKDGKIHKPTVAGAVFIGIFMIAFGAFWLNMVGNMGAPGIFTLAGVFIIVMGILTIFGGTFAAKNFQRSRSNYQRRRQKLESRLQRKRR